MPEVKSKMRYLRYLAWVFLTMLGLATLDYDFIHYQLEQEKRDQAQREPLWESNWSQLKLGMTKEDALHLLGQPSSTYVMETHLTNSSSNSQATQSLEKIIDQKMNYAIWSYNGTIEMHPKPDEGVNTVIGQAFTQVMTQANATGDGKLHGHAIKFDGAGHAVEISSD